MSTIEEFKNAPAGATAIHKVSGSRVMKVNDGEQYWITSWGSYLSDGQMGLCDYMLDPLEPAPTTAREALDLAWELGHEVKEGHVIPRGTRYLEVTGTGLKEYTAQADFKVSPEFAPIRTFDPLPDPEPDWLDAPAVIAHVDAPNVQPTSVFVPTGTHPDRWARFDSEWTFHWNELRNVIPLYPREGQNS